MSWSDKALAAESLVMLAAARILVKAGRQKNLVSRLGAGSADATRFVETESTSALTGGETLLGAGRSSSMQIGSMVERTSRITWWRSMCLEKALAGKWMLRRRSIPCTMFVGMARRGGEFIAHAWLVSEGRTVTGAGETIYATLAAFREAPKSGVRG